MAFAPGTVLGPYEITSLLGRGGMGEVWRAHDKRLGRDVAIKTLPDEFATNEERLARFQREAKLLAPLNHPNIASIYGLEESTGACFLVLELVEGETLAERLTRGPIPVEEAIPLALQIAAALEAAHEKGIVHRDLKPGNIKVTPDGKVKVLDFGLAKALANDASGSALSNSPTLSMAATQQGVILGTAAYMSPEQARGRSVDKRTDVWGFGCVLYEMLTGQQPFEGADVSEVLAGVIKSDPDWNALPAAVPPMLRAFLRRCLEKDPNRRIHDIADVRLALEGAFDAAVTPTASANTKPKNSRRMMFVGASAFLSAALLATLLSWVALRPAAMPVVRLTATPPGPIQLANNPGALDGDITISPDGSHIVYAMGDTNLTQQLYVRALDQLEARALPGTNSARSPFISPDGNWIGFFEESERVDIKGSLKKIAMNGGPAVKICSIQGFPRGASWGTDDRIIFATGGTPESGLLRVDAGGGTPEVLTRPESEKNQPDHLFPEILPGGRAVLFTIARGGPDQNAQIAVLDLATGKQKVLIQAGSNPHYAASGYIVYAIAGTLRAVPFDINRLEISGNPVPVIEHAVIKSSGAAEFSMSQDGTLVYVAGDNQSSLDRTLVWVDRQGHEEPVGAPPRVYAYARISPDGTRAALDIRDQDNDIWIWDFMRRTLTRLTFDPGLNREAVWTPDGRRLAFSAQREGSEDIYWQAADGTGSPEPLTKGASLQPSAFSPDGKRLLVTPLAGQRDIVIVNIDGEHRIEPLSHTAFNEENAEISPDSRWIAYQSDESGNEEIYVRPFPEINGGRWQISVDGGTRPAWARNGHELFYYLDPGKLMAVTIQPGSSFAASSPQVIFEGQYLSAPLVGRHYDVSPDGKRFLMIKDSQSAKGTTPNQLIVVLNWFEELKRLPRK